jgi:hypothetical protein
MSFSSWLRNRTSNRASRAHFRPHLSFRPELEALQDRCLPSFLSPVSYATGSNPHAVVTADLNHDGRVDIITANGGSNSVSVLLGNRNGTFAAAQNYAVGASPLSVAVGDFNDDGKLDIVTGNADGSISLLLGKANGTFRPAQKIAAAGGGSYLAVADVNGDGNPDLVTNYGGVSVLLGNGNGTFRAVQTNATAGGAVAVGDFNRDGKLDVIAVNNPYSFGNSITLSLLRGNGDGTFASPQTIFSYTSYAYYVGVLFGTATVADFNGDGKLDLAFTSQEFAEVTGGPIPVVGTVLLGNGDGTFVSGGTFRFNAAFGSIDKMGNLVAADINHDGFLDLITVSGGEIEIAPGHGDGTFGVTQEFYSQFGGRSYTAVAVADFNGDGYPDVVATWTDPYGGGSSGIDVWLNDKHWSNFF